MTKKNKISAGRAGIPNPVDMFVGMKFKERRSLMGLSQTELADALGITFQQVQKYEKGTNRISVSRLVDICDILDVTIDYFTKDIPTPVQEQSPRKRAKVMKEIEIDENTMAKRETLTLVRWYYKVPSAQRKSVINLCRQLAKAVKND